jgi:4-diphosphocytidyl-2C-methyl-D-erythritol kinase
VTEPRWERFRNDLQPVVLGGWKAVADVVHTLRVCRPLMAAVTGSGAAAFALFRERAAAARAAAAVGAGSRVHLGVTLDRASALLGVRAR